MHEAQCCRVEEQGQHLKSSLAALTGLQKSDNRAQMRFTSQADSLLHGYQTLLAQVASSLPC